MGGVIEFVTPEPADVASPCVNVCVIGGDDLCEGCARTLAAIAGWSEATPEGKRAVLERVAGRRAAERYAVAAAIAASSSSAARPYAGRACSRST